MCEKSSDDDNQQILPALTEHSVLEQSIEEGNVNYNLCHIVLLLSILFCRQIYSNT